MKKLSHLLFIAALLTIAGCTKPSESNTNTTIPDGPTVTTAEAQNITSTSALLGGTITAEGLCTVLTSGVVLSTAHNPTTSDVTLPNTTTSGISSFSVMATGLLPSTTYYARLRCQLQRG